jgi:predicted Rossmann fold nucleotide-binding protein DprA/Smf involved in DNA uptake
MIKVIIAGGRDFNDYALLERILTRLLSKTPLEEVLIISGGAKGADKLGERYAKEKGIALQVFPADWDKHGKKAGYLRNAEMAKEGTHLVAFWDGQSKGTKHMIDLARKRNLDVRIISYTK